MVVPSWMTMASKLISNYKIVIIVLIIMCNMAYLWYSVSLHRRISEKYPVYVNSDSREDKKYIIDTPGCRIENLNAFSDDIKEYVHKVEKISCRDKELLTYISRYKDIVTLNLNKSMLSDYSTFNVKCCYSTIRRDPFGSNPDDNLIFSDCNTFTDNVIVTEDFVKVECSNFFGKVYENVHSTLQPPKQTVSNKDDPNVILIGIDGVSRSNLIRSMPKTFEFCERDNWISLKGYTKIEDNTFPNLIAVLAGLSFPQAEKECNPYHRDILNNCNFIWKKYKQQNYSTAYAEDTPKIATFNGIKTGFTNPPTDYYFRPYFLTADQLTPTYLCLKAHCTGPEKTGIRMQNLIDAFLSTTRNVTPGFGLFWMNSFSHEDVNCPSSMDDDFVNFFEEMQRKGYLDNTIVVFFSDHGFRFGKIRLTHTGWMEERLPFIYIRTPDNFRLKYAEEFYHLKENSEKLTTPYDLYMTLQHILNLSNKTFVETPSKGCPKCQSLFKPIPLDRTCNQSGIPQHYCACSEYEKLDKNTFLVEEAADFFVNKINKLIKSYGSDSMGCATYMLERITHAKSLVIKQGSEENILIGIVTNPEAIFEATVKVLRDEYDNSTKFILMETNRLDRYAPKTFCVQDSPVQMYCYCKSLLKRVTNIFCNNKFCFLYIWLLFLLPTYFNNFIKNAQAGK